MIAYMVRDIATYIVTYMVSDMVPCKTTNEWHCKKKQ